MQHQPAMPPKTRGFAIASMVCGISSLLLCCLGMALPLAALGILFALLSHRKGHYLSGFSITGIVTACSGMVLGIIYLLLVIFLYQFEESQPPRENVQEYNENTEDSPYFEEYFEDFPYFEGYDMPPYSEEYGGEYNTLPFVEEFDIPHDYNGFSLY